MTRTRRGPPLHRGPARALESQVPRSIEVDQYLVLSADREDGEVTNVGGEREQRRVQEFPLGPSQPSLMLLLQPPNDAAERLLGSSARVPERLELRAQLLRERATELLRRSGQILGCGERAGRALRREGRRR